MEPLFASVSLRGALIIQFATEALRTHPRRSERVLGVYSLSSVLMVSHSFVIIGRFAYIIDHFGVIKAAID